MWPFILWGIIIAGLAFDYHSVGWFIFGLILAALGVFFYFWPKGDGGSSGGTHISGTFHPD